jgi:hypothetical protein
VSQCTRGCGKTINYRYIDGICIPLGCGCNGRGGKRRSPGRPVDVKKPWRSGFGTVPWRLSYRTQCFWCPEEVFYHTNGYGDCVLLDELEPPWPVHWCWEKHRGERRGAVIESTMAIVHSGVRSERLDRSDRWLEQMEEKVPTGSWWSYAAEQDHRIYRAGRQYDLTAPPRPVDTAVPGPYLLLNWVASRSELYFHAPGMPVLESGWNGITIGIRDLTVFIPRDLAVRLKVGDPFVAEIEAFGSRGRCVYLAKRLRTQKGGRIDVY